MFKSIINFFSGDKRKVNAFLKDWKYGLTMEQQCNRLAEQGMSALEGNFSKKKIEELIKSNAPIITKMVKLDVDILDLADDIHGKVEKKNETKKSLVEKAKEFVGAGEESEETDEEKAEREANEKAQADHDKRLAKALLAEINAGKAATAKAQPVQAQ